MNILRDYWTMIRKTSGDKLFLSFLIFYLIDCYLIYRFDPSLSSYGDALWMGFSVATTIGLGDFTVTTTAARVCTILLGIYGSIMEAYIPGLIASWYLQKLSDKRDQMIARHADQLSRLDTMSTQQKKSLSASIRKGGSSHE